MRKPLLLIAKIAVTCGAFAWVAQTVHWPDLWQMVHTQALPLVAIAAILILIQVLSGGVRWHLLLGAIDRISAARLTRFAAMRLFYISVFFNTCLPGTIGGDVVRVFLCRAKNIPMPSAIHSVVLDRVIALVALIIMSLAGLPLIITSLDVSWLELFALMGACILLALAVLLHLHYLPEKIRRTKIGQALLHLSKDARMLFLHPLTALGLLALTLMTHGLYCLSMFWLARSLSIELTMIQALQLIPLVMLLAVIPLSIGGWGLREMGMVLVLGAIGVPSEAALMLSLQHGLLTMLMVMPGGIMWLLSRKPAEAEV